MGNDRQGEAPTHTTGSRSVGKARTRSGDLGARRRTGGGSPSWTATLRRMIARKRSGQGMEVERAGELSFGEGMPSQIFLNEVVGPTWFESG